MMVSIKVAASGNAVAVAFGYSRVHKFSKYDGSR